MACLAAKVLLRVCACAVRDTRRAEGPGGTKVLARYQLDPKVKDEVLEVGLAPGWPASNLGGYRSLSARGAGEGRRRGGRGGGGDVAVEGWPPQCREERVASS